ncbi:MAG: hypothetical protein PHV59_11650 [Victivallales bacterium]|nr:hypothetical protein [Victivallales bacterium]
MKKQLIFLAAGVLGAVAFGAETKYIADKAADFTPGLKDRADGVLCLDTAKYYLTRKYQPIDSSKSYSVSGEFRVAKGDFSGNIVFSVAQYTENGRRIVGMHFFIIPETETELVAPAEKGATSIKVKDTSKWIRDPKRLRGYHLAFNVDPSGQCGDLPNFEISPILGKFTTGDGFTEVKLESPLAKAYPKGTHVRMHFDSWFWGSYVSTKLTGEWKKLELTIKPAQADSIKKPQHHCWWPGAVKAGFLIAPWPFKSLQEGTEIEMRNLELTEL